MAIYKLTPDAEQDLSHIYQWGYETFGEEQADLYFLGLLDRFEAVASNPLQYTNVDHIYEGARRALYGRDSIYFLTIEDGIIIIGVIGQQDLEGRF